MIHEEHSNGTTKGFLMGLLAGGAVGAGFALLYTPKTGKEMREEIGRRTDEYKSIAREKASTILKDVEHRTDNLLTATQRKMNSLLEDAEHALSSARTKTDKVVEQGTRVKAAARAGVDAFQEERKRAH